MLQAFWRGLVMAAIATPALAQMDLPHDLTDGSYVTLEEVRANSRKVFAAFAEPGDGPIPRERFVSKILPAEVVPSMPDRQLLERLFDALDANGDAHLARAEWEDQINRDLAFADENEDGRITLKELANARENIGIGDAISMLF